MVNELSAAARAPRAGRWRFLAEFARSPLRTAALAPSSSALAAAMIERIHDCPRDPVLVELGPGTGVFTEAIQDSLGERGTHIAIECNPRFTTDLRRRFARVDVVQASAHAVANILGERGLPRADFVVSGLPWAAYWSEGSLVAKIARCLTADGCFTQFGYPLTRWAPPARRQAREFSAFFADVHTSPVVWRNLPPAVVYSCRNPRAIHA